MPQQNPSPIKIDPAATPHQATTSSPNSTLAQSQGSLEAAALANSTSSLLSEYEIERELGRGGMGVVYLARPKSGDGAPVAIKLLSCGLSDSDPAKARFRIEGDALARLRHPNIIALLSAADGPGMPRLVQEYAPGGSLKEMIQAHPLAPEEAAKLVEILAQAIHHAHELGVLHRDIKPGNILFGKKADPDCPRIKPSELEPKVADFGLARLSDSDFQYTATGDLLGTPSYMAPEQAAGLAKHSARPTDVWALGAMLYECLSGKTPFVGSTRLEVLDQVRTADPLPPSSHRPGISRDLDVICLKCLRKEKEKRYQTAAELADDLRRFLEDRPIKARPVGLLERAVKWRRRNPAVSALGMAAAVLISLSALTFSWYWDSHLRVKTEHFSSIVWRRGVAEGINPIQPGSFGNRSLAFRLTRQGNRPLSLETVNGSGRSTTMDTDPADPFDQRGTSSSPVRWDFQYTQSGEPQSVSASDKHGNSLWIQVFTAKDRCQFTDAAGSPLDRSSSGVTGLGFVWSKEGLPSEVRFLDRNGRPRPDDAGVAGYRLEHDSQGHVVKCASLARDGSPGWHRIGRYSIISQAFDPSGNLTEKTFADSTDRPVLETQSWVCRMKSTFDDSGNEIEAESLDQNMHPVVNRNGWARIVRTFARGNLVEESFFNSTGKSVPGSSGFAKATYEHDSRGNIVSERYFDPDSRPCPSKSGSARVVRAFDSADNPTSEEYFDESGKPVTITDGYASKTMVYDPRGHILGESYFDSLGQPTEGKDGVASVSRTVDSRGQQLEKTFRGRDGSPIFGPDGYATIRIRYDDQGRVTEQAFLDPKGNPAIHKDGYSKITRKYDDSGFGTEEAFFGMRGQPVNGPKGYAREAHRRDDQGRVVEQAYFDSKGEPVAFNKDNYVRFSIEYDEAGNRSREIAFGPDGKPVPNKEGYARVDYSWNGKGLVTEHRYFMGDGKPAMRRSSFSQLVMRYDERGNLIEESYHGPDGNLAMQPEGFARWVDEYDMRGLRVKRSYFGPDGLPSRHRDDGWSFTQAYDDSGRNTETKWYKPDGQLTPNKLGHAIFRIAYDARGERMEEASFGPDGRPVICADGYASKRTYPLPTGVTSVETYHGVSGELVNSKDGPARTTYRYNERWQPIEIAYFGSNDQPVVEKNIGAAIIAQSFDRFGHLSGQDYFGVDGKLRTTGVIHFRKEYDDQGRNIRNELDSAESPNIRQIQKLDTNGRMVEQSFIAKATGKPINGPKGFALLQTEYDERGNQIKYQVSDENGKPSYALGNSKQLAKYNPIGKKVETTDWLKEGVARLKYDDADRVTSIEFLEEDGQPRIGPAGYASVKTSYDSKGNLISKKFLGADGRSCRSNAGYARSEFVFDSSGREIEHRLFDVDSSPINGNKGYHRNTSRYDDAGRLLELAWYKEDGSPSPQSDNDDAYRFTVAYDSQGVCREASFYTLEGRKRMLLNTKSKPVEISFFDKAGAPKIREEGYFRETRKYDDQGRIIGASFFGTDGKPALYKGKYASYSVTFGKDGKQLKRTEYGPDGKPGD